MVLIAGLLAGALGLAGCASQSAPAYSWSHAASGEYLFAFDTGECEEIASTVTAMAPTASREFFACMLDRGYFLVDPATGLPLAAGRAEGLPDTSAPQAAR